jgi:hypothetical protein
MLSSSIFHQLEFVVRNVCKPYRIYLDIGTSIRDFIYVACPPFSYISSWFRILALDRQRKLTPRQRTSEKSRLRPLVTISVTAELKPKLEKRDCFVVGIILPLPTRLARRLMRE